MRRERVKLVETGNLEPPMSTAGQNVVMINVAFMSFNKHCLFFFLLYIFQKKSAFDRRYLSFRLRPVLTLIGGETAAATLPAKS